MLYPRGGVWWVKFKHRGRTHRESTGLPVTSERAGPEARAAERRIKAEAILREGPGGRATSEVTLAILEELHVEYLENKGFGELRVETVRNLWRHLQHHLGEHRDVMRLTARDIEAYEGKRRAEKHRGERTRGQTIRRERGALHRAMKLAKRDGLIEAMPFDWDEVEPITSDTKKASQAAKLHGVATVELVLASLSAKARAAGHEHICRFVMMTGLRSAELARSASFAVSPLKRKRGSTAVALLHVPDDGSKTSRPRAIPLTRQALDIFEAWSHRFAIADVPHALIRASKAAGVRPGVTLRDLRKFYGSHAARDDLAAAQKLLGHTKVSTTALYVDADLDRSIEAGTRVTRLARGHTPGAQCPLWRRCVVSPIRKENRKRYPPNWKALSAHIRFVRANGRCECTGQCGLHHERRCEERHGRPARWARGRVVLTVAHLDHVPEHCDHANLKAMCQRCHLLYDREHHAETRALTRGAAVRRPGAV